MGNVFAQPTETVPVESEGPPEIEEDENDLSMFDRSALAQVKKGSLHTNYEVLEELGSGSFGVVNKGRDVRARGVSLATWVAIKTIPKKKIKDPNKIKAEFNVLRQLDHAHICKAYECYEDRRNIYLVMDICTGGTLLETLCKQHKFSEKDVSNVMRQMLSALAYLHQSNFIFRDLKTENVMFATPVKQGEVGNVKLIDFGLCCPFEKGTRLAKAAGTPYSVAPELVTAPVQYDQKCDAWSAGVVMYIMLSGQYPFRGKTKDELLHAIRREPVSFKDKRWKKISKEAKTLMAEMLRKKPETRCDIIEALEHSWISSETPLPTEDIMQDVLASMMHFQSLNMLQKASITALAWRASDEDTQHLRLIFESIDRDGNGFVTVEELRRAFEKTGVMVPEDLALLAVQAGTDGNDTIEYTEFIAAAMDKKKILKEEVVWEAFKIFDVDGNGTVTKKELMKILTGRASDKIRQVHGDKAIDNFLDEYDQTGDDVIDFDEFMAMLNSATVQQAGPLKQRKTVNNGRLVDGCLGNLKSVILSPCTAPAKADPASVRAEPTSGRSQRSGARRSTGSKEASSRSPATGRKSRA
jgi:calcium-dependent protein kinase